MSSSIDARNGLYPSSLAAFRHGPEATPFSINSSGGVIDAAGRIPFHGIISRALLDHARGATDALSDWGAFGHRLDEIVYSEDEPGITAWRRAARGCGVLSFAQSAVAACAYAGRLARPADAARVLDLAIASGEEPAIALWNVKEGHTSSVWHARFECAAGAAECAINVARDPVAGRELRRTSRIMRRIAQSWPEANLARVREIASVRLPDLADPVVVTSNDWIAGARELHRLPGNPGTNGLLVAVERFITEPGMPAHIRRIAGNRLDPAETARVEHDLTEFLARGAEFGVELDINDGDLVWDGLRAIIVAIR